MKRILVANRGEIAVRVMRTLRELGLTSIALYSDADRNSAHIRWADEAYYLGGSPPSESYLNIERILDVARKCRADAIHPGYGFLSENALFAEACEMACVTFIGPRARTIAAMGDKIEARGYAARAGLSMTPASPALSGAADAKEWAQKIGYPVLLKAKAGGGGKGMRRVDSEAGIEEAYRLAQSEAEKAFGDGTMYMEKFVLDPRHVEVQIFADQNGNTIFLGDRECSIQRRHQKIIEEAPAPHLTEKTKAAMGEAAIKISKAVDYVGAGTVEFLVDKNENFYFLEMNTRLQVEHPVTEWITGLDLVEWQIAVASGKPLPLGQEEILLRGHALEARIYAEDPANKFLPCPGTIRFVSWPRGPGVRLDTGVETGSEVSLFYDPMIAKASVWAKDRPAAVQRLKRALGELRLKGVKTNLSFLQQIIERERFAEGKLTTAFIEEGGPFEWGDIDPLELDAALATLSITTESRPRSSKKPTGSAWWASGLPKDGGA